MTKKKNKRRKITKRKRQNKKEKNTKLKRKKEEKKRGNRVEGLCICMSVRMPVHVCMYILFVNAYVVRNDMVDKLEIKKDKKYIKSNLHS